MKGKECVCDRFDDFAHGLCRCVVCDPGQRQLGFWCVSVSHKGFEMTIRQKINSQLRNSFSQMSKRNDIKLRRTTRTLHIISVSTWLPIPFHSFRKRVQPSSVPRLQLFTLLHAQYAYAHQKTTTVSSGRLACYHYRLIMFLMFSKMYVQVHQVQVIQTRNEGTCSMEIRIKWSTREEYWELMISHFKIAKYFAAGKWFRFFSAVSVFPT